MTPPDDFICFGNGKVKRFKNKHDDSWDYFLWDGDDNDWTFHDNVCLATVVSHYERASLVSIPLSVK